MFIGAKIDIKDIPFVTFLKEDYDMDREFKMSENNQPISLRCFVPTVVDPKLASEGYHCISVVVIASYDKWIKFYNQGKDVYAGKIERLSTTLMYMLKKISPSLYDNQILVKRMITLMDLSQLTFNNSGALYGWELIPSQSGIKRLTFKTPITGLYMVGQWTIPGGSVCLIFRGVDLVSSSILEDIRKQH